MQWEITGDYGRRLREITVGDYGRLREEITGDYGRRRSELERTRVWWEWWWAWRWAWRWEWWRRMGNRAAYPR
jgi:hypothetical protein